MRWKTKALGIIIVVPLCIAMLLFIAKLNHSTSVSQGIKLSFASTVKAKGFHHALILELNDGPNLLKYSLDHEMYSVEVGDSLVKIEDENVCTVYKPDGRVLRLKFIYER